MAKRLYKNKKILILLAAVAILAVGSALYVKASQKKATPSPGQTSTQDTTTHAGPATDQSTKSPQTPTPTSVSTPDHPITSSLAKPIGPNDNTGSVSLSGATMMESTCRSVAGASCYIQATKDTQVIIVSQTKTIGGDADGVVLDWDANQLSVGTWSISAVAAKDGSKAVSDPQTLKVTK
jgi:hypothetical protein